MVFLGTINQTVDAKKRTVIPACFRDEFKNGEIVIFTRPNHCISIYKPDVFDEMVLKMNLEARGEAERQKVKNVTANSRRITFDTAGRFTLPPEFIKHAEINTDVCVVGCVQTLELWSKENFDRSNYISSENLTMDDVPEDLL